MALYDTGDDNTATVAPELTSQIAPNWTICMRRPACSVHQSAARIKRYAHYCRKAFAVPLAVESRTHL
jgi:hypothetical protein